MSHLTNIKLGCDWFMYSEILPPWVQYPDKPPWWGGWRQGNSELWLHEEWFPFWYAMSRLEQLQYLASRRVPDDWIDHVLEFWVHDELDPNTAK